MLFCVDVYVCTLIDKQIYVCTYIYFLNRVHVCRLCVLFVIIHILCIGTGPQSIKSQKSFRMPLYTDRSQL